MGIGVWELLLIFLIVLVVFGTKRLRGIGGDLGSAIKSFRSAMSDGESKREDETTAEGQAKPENKSEA